MTKISYRQRHGASFAIVIVLFLLCVFTDATGVVAVEEEEDVGLAAAVAVSSSENIISDRDLGVVTLHPTKRPTTLKPSRPPTFEPTKRPTTQKPTRSPTFEPTKRPTRQKPTRSPTFQPTKRPSTTKPSKRPTGTPTTRAVTNSPTKRPTFEPTTRPSSLRPTKRPTSLRPTSQSPTKRPTSKRPTSLSPTKRPTSTPTFSDSPTKRPTRLPTLLPTKRPTRLPTRRPTTGTPTSYPTKFCAPGDVLCGLNSCMPNGASCCDARNGIYCPADSTCLRQANRIWDCCAWGICNGKCCPCDFSKEKLCGNRCLPKSVTCCSHSSDCPANNVCTILNPPSPLKICQDCGDRGVCGSTCCACDGKPTPVTAPQCQDDVPVCCKNTFSNLWGCIPLLSKCCPDGSSCMPTASSSEDCCTAGSRR